MPHNQCRLCSSSLLLLQVHDEEGVFCCHGCQAVYHILKHSDALHNPFQSPVYQNALAQGLIANPEAKKKAVFTKTAEEKKLLLEVEGLMCSSCATLIELVLYQLEGVLEVHVDFSTDLCVVRYDPKKLPKERIKKAIYTIGYSAHFLSLEKEKEKEKKSVLRLIFALFCSLNIMMLSYPVYVSYFWPVAKEYTFFFHTTCFAFALFQAFPAFPIGKKAFFFARMGRVSVETLITAAFFSALLLALYSLLYSKPYFFLDSSSAIVALKFLGEYITASQKRGIKTSLFSLFRSLPCKVRLYNQEKGWFWSDVKEVHPGDLIQIRPQEKAPLDGTVVEGIGYFDESLLTGEVKPQKRAVGDFICSGALLLSGDLTVKVSSSYTRSFAYRLIEYVETKMGKKRSSLPLVEQIVGWFLPSVLLLASLVFSYGFVSGQVQMMSARALSLLVIACPCAIGIAMPLVEARLMQTLSENAIFVRNPEAMWEIAKVKNLLFDKTGTLTVGRYAVQTSLAILTDKERKQAAALAKITSHPVAQAVAEACSELFPDKTIKELIFVGKGVQAFFPKGDMAALGSVSFIADLTKNRLSLPKTSEPLFSLACLYFSDSNKQIPIYLGDKLREESFGVLKKLENYQTYLCSGDREEVVKSVAEALNMNGFFAEASPSKKETVVKAIQRRGEKVAFIGDGMNDVLALSTADVGISFGKKSETSAFAADINICEENLHFLPLLIQWVKRGEQIIAQNLFWAFFYNFIGIFLALGGFLHPLYAAFAMWASSLIVLANAYRAFYRRESNFPLKG